MRGFFFTNRNTIFVFDDFRVPHLKIDDKILLIALRERKEKAFDMIFNKYFKSIYYFISLNCKSTADAEDMAQEVFVRLWESGQVPTVSLKGYLYTIARNVVIDWTRRSINKMVFDALAEEQHATLMVESELNEKTSLENLLSIIHRIAQSMPERRLEVYRLRWIEGLSRKEIAQRMGITVTTVDIHIQKALEYLRMEISKLPDESRGIFVLLILVLSGILV